jgi:hypothetical protein
LKNVSAPVQGEGEAVALVQEEDEVKPFQRLQVRPLTAAERHAELERETASHKAQLEKDLQEAAHRRRLDTIGFSVLVTVLLVGFVCGILPASWLGDQKWAQSIASAVLGLLIGRYTMQKKS